MWLFAIMLVNVDVTFVIRNIVRGISESLSEACNQVMSLPPRHEHPCTRDFEIIELGDTPDVDDDFVSSDGAPATRLLADMRVETADSVLHTGSGMPGRVENDSDEQSFEDVFEGTLGVSLSSSLVRKVNDDPADNEVCVIAEVEYTAGTTLSDTVASCERKYRCTKCNNKFLTATALKVHESTAHKEDTRGIGKNERVSIPTEAFGCVITPRSISTNVPGSVGDLTNGVRNASNSSCSPSWPPVEFHQHSSSNSHHIAAVSALPYESGTALLKRRTAAICSDIITLSDDEPDPSDAKRPPMPVPNAVVERQPASSSDLGCEICQESMATPQIRSLHELHTNRMKWFCLDCATPQVDEVEAVKHYFSVHVKAAEQEATARGILFRPIHYQLRCPFDECRQLLSTPKGLRLHLNKMHRAATTSSSTICGFRFCSPPAKEIHTGKHATYERLNGVEGTCCPLCGTLNNWNIQVPGTSYTISHLAVHGLRRYDTCRDCFRCFKRDFDCVLMKDHFKTTHCIALPETENRDLLCKTCSEVIPKSHLAEHVIDKHRVTCFESRDPENKGQLIVKTGAVTRRFLGFRVIQNFGEHSDMD